MLLLYDSSCHTQGHSTSCRARAKLVLKVRRWGWEPIRNARRGLGSGRRFPRRKSGDRQQSSPESYDGPDEKRDPAPLMNALACGAG